MSRLDYCKYDLVGDCYDWKNDNCDECNIFKAYCEGARRAKNSIVRCKDCKHRPHLENENGSDYGFNVSGDEMCPCVNEDDGWYSWMPKDNFYCGFGERKGGGSE